MPSFGTKIHEAREMDPRENLIYLIINPSVHSAHLYTHSVNILRYPSGARHRMLLQDDCAGQYLQDSEKEFCSLSNDALAMYRISLSGDMGNLKPFN